MYTHLNSTSKKAFLSFDCFKVTYFLLQVSPLFFMKAPPINFKPIIYLTLQVKVEVQRSNGQCSIVQCSPSLVVTYQFTGGRETIEAEFLFIIIVMIRYYNSSSSSSSRLRAKYFLSKQIPTISPHRTEMST
jgi:hypothetical protein